MRLTSFLRPRRSLTRRRAARRPILEPLEGRTVLSQVSLSVTSLADSGPGTLRAAILTADAGSPRDKFKIGFAVTGTIDLQNPLPDLSNTIAVQSPGASSLTVERAAGASFSSAIITVDAGQTASLSGLTIANGDAGGIRNYGTLTVSDSTVSGNSVLFRSGAGIQNWGTLTVSGSTVSGNFSTASGGFGSNGGGIFTSYGSNLTISGSTIAGNTADYAGGILCENGATMTISGSTIAGNTATYAGGAIYNMGAATITQSTLSCSTAGGGGGIFNDGGSMMVNSSTFSDNTAGGGGAIWNDSVLTVRDSTFCGNSATDGGAVYNDFYGTTTLSGSVLTGNTATVCGGALDNIGTVTMHECSLSGNTAGSRGGGIFNGTGAVLTLDDSVVTGNIAPIGADLDDLGTTILNDSTVGVIGH
jgi:hypothetical protein